MDETGPRVAPIHQCARCKDIGFCRSPFGVRGCAQCADDEAVLNGGAAGGPALRWFCDACAPALEAHATPLSDDETETPRCVC
jgi:hypothetical protein